MTQMYWLARVRCEPSTGGVKGIRMEPRMGHDVVRRWVENPLVVLEDLPIRAAQKGVTTSITPTTEQPHQKDSRCVRTSIS